MAKKLGVRAGWNGAPLSCKLKFNVELCCFFSFLAVLGFYLFDHILLVKCDGDYAVAVMCRGLSSY